MGVMRLNLEVVSSVGMMIYVSYDHLPIMGEILGAMWHVLEVDENDGMVVYSIYDYIPILLSVWHIL